MDILNEAQQVKTHLILTNYSYLTHICYQSVSENIAKYDETVKALLCSMESIRPCAETAAQASQSHELTLVGDSIRAILLLTEDACQFIKSYAGNCQRGKVKVHDEYSG